jgi:maltose/moltooligosaccharide transporter
MGDTRRYGVGTLRYTSAGLAIVVFWLLFGEFAIAFRDRAAVPSVTELLRQHGASDTAMALLVSALPALLGSVLVPVIGFRSDRFRSRWGRRLPFLMATTPLGALTLVALGYCNEFGRLTNASLGALSPGLDSCVLAWFCVCWTLFEGVALVTLALYSGLVNDIVPRPVLGRFYAGFRIAGLGAGILFNLWIFHLTDAYLREVFIGVGIFFGAACMLMCVRLKEGGYAPPAPLPDGATAHGWRDMWASYRRECFADRYYLLIFSILMTAELAFVPFNTFSQLYGQSLGMDKAMLGKLLATSYAVSIVLSSPIGWLVDRHGAVAMSQLTMALYLAASTAGALFVDDARSFAVVYVVHVVVSGAYFTAAASLPMVLFPRARFLQFDAAKRFFGSGATIVLSFLLGPMLDWTGHRYFLTLPYGALLALACLAGFRIIHRTWGARLRAGSST